MFLTGYCLLIIFAAIPLVRTFRGNRHGESRIVFLHRLYRDLGYIAAALLAIICFETALTISLQDLWFGELGQRNRYWLSLGLRFEIFFAVLVSVGLFAGANLRELTRSLPNIPKSAPWFVGFIFAGVVAFGATDLWITLLGFLGASPTGIVDPVFGNDLSFYILALPWYDALVGIASTVVVITICLWFFAGLHFFRGAGSPLDRLTSRVGRGTARALRVVDSGKTDGQAQIAERRQRWVRQGLIIGACLCLTSGLSRLLGRYHLIINGHSQVVAGGSYADVNFWIPAFGLVMVSWFAAACLLLAAAFLPSVRRWLAVRRSNWLWPCALFATVYVGAAIIPWVVEHLYVGPNQITLEQPYVIRSIAGTRAGFNLSGPSVEEREFPVSSAALTQQDLDKNAATLRDARIWDWRALEPQLQQTQGLRPYYNFSGVDIDRYMVDGVERQVMITARELNVEKLPNQAKVWVNLALKYTHGYGAVAAPVNEIDSSGNPVLWAHDIPLSAKGDLAVKQGAIYYGELTQDRVYVRTSEREFDFPQGQANAETVYQGRGGIALSSFWRKLVVAHETDGLRLFISGYFRPDSRVLLRRNIVERVQRLAPFLTFDGDPYLVANGEHYSYIIDGYVRSSNYPYSERYAGSQASFQGGNYLRNSVKAVVDAYDGSVTFYVFDSHDPIIRAYRRMLPELFKDRSAMPANLQRHIRYPEGLFTAQAEMYGTYHMTNPTTFYNREDRWEVPHELFHNEQIELSPYYVTTQLPNSNKPEFLLMLTMSVAGKNQMAGWLAGRSDGENYGKFIAYRFPKGMFIDGPAQIESRINSDSRFSPDLSLWVLISAES